MSRIEDHLLQTSSHQRNKLPCGKCFGVIEYDKGANWRVVSQLANEHWKACKGKAHATVACSPTSPLDTTIGSSPPAAPKPDAVPEPAPRLSNSNSDITTTTTTAATTATTTWIAPGCERRRRTLEQRKLELELDEYTKNVREKSVVCTGCNKEISLDKRSEYYPGLWNKHRSKCPGIEKLERAKVNPKVQQQSPSNDSQRWQGGSCDIAVPAVSSSNGRGDGVVEPGPVEAHCESRDRATAYHQSVHQQDSEEVSSDDSEDEDGDEEPFPTLNKEYYYMHMHNSKSEWTYRYATKDEIAMNLFRGQDEPHRPERSPSSFGSPSLASCLCPQKPESSRTAGRVFASWRC